MANPVPWESLPEDIRKEIVNLCQSKGCQDAKNELVRIRNDIKATCTQLDTAKSQRDVYAAVAAASAAAAAVAAVGAAVTPWPFNLVLWIIVSVLATLAIIFGTLAANRQNLVAGLSTAISNKQSDFMSGVQTMNSACPEQCREDTALPTC
jgi:hypothetical protein